MNPPPAAALRLERVGRRFGAHEALVDLDLAVAPGECVGLVGRNGAGKTTTLRIAAGLLPPSSGRVTLFGLDPEREPVAVKRRLGLVAQDDELFGALTAVQFLELVGRLHRRERREIAARSAELFELLEIDAPAGHVLSELSFGTRKKVALAAAILPGPELLLLDEPFEGLDPIAGRCVRLLIEDLTRAGVAILLSSHQLGQVERLAERTLLIERGRVVASGTLAELRAAHPGTDDLETLLAALVDRGAPRRLSWL